MVYDILELLFWMAVATLGLVVSFYGLYLMAVEDPWIWYGSQAVLDYLD